MKLIFVILGVLLAGDSVRAQERLSRAESLKYAFFLALDLKQMVATPIPTDPDVKRPVALRGEDRGGLLLPESKLDEQKLAKAGREVIPVGQLWLVKLAPVAGGQPVPASKLRLVEVKAESAQATAACCALGARKNAEGALELLVYGKDKDPLVRVPLASVSGQANPEAPIDISAERKDDTAELTLKLLGKYQASFTLGATEF